MNNLAIDSALKASNFLNLINIHSKNVFDNIILNSDLNGTIVAGSLNVWNFNFRQILQNNKGNIYWYIMSDDYPIDSDKSSVTDHGVRVLIKYRE